MKKELTIIATRELSMARAHRGAGGKRGGTPVLAKRPQLQVLPGTRMGEFEIGMPLGCAMNILKAQYLTFRHVIFEYSNDNPGEQVCSLVSKDLNMTLCFEPELQQLISVTVKEPTDLILTYNVEGQGVKFVNEAHRACTINHILNTFGPSSGVYDKAEKCYKLQYPGLSFSFPIPNDAELQYENGIVDLTQHPDSRLPNGEVPVLGEIKVFGDIKSSRSRLTRQPFYGETVEVTEGKGLYFAKRSCHVNFGMSAQDVITTIGPPSDVFYKAHDKMKIHCKAKKSSSTQPTGGPDYFFNYFDLGIDILFSGGTHVAIKFILHSNQPGHFNFDRYLRCNFEVKLGRFGAPPSPRRKSKSNSSSSISSSRPDHGAVDLVVTQQPGRVVKQKPTDGKKGTSGDTAPKDDDLIDDKMQLIDLNDDEDDDNKNGEEEEVVDIDDQILADRSAMSSIMVTPITPWNFVEDCLPKGTGRPVAFNREPSTNATNPFGPTQLYHLRQIIFEVMMNGSIAAVTIVSPTIDA